jgi:hypothetical protein
VAESAAEIRRYLHDTGKSLFVWDCVVADGVAVETVSDTIFRHNSEKYRENQINVIRIAAASSSNAASMGVFDDFLWQK